MEDGLYHYYMYTMCYVIVIPCMQRLHQFYQLEPKGVARGRELIKTDAAFACMVQLIYS